MEKPTGPILLFTILYIIGIVIGYKNRNYAGYGLFIWCIISLIIYFIGNSHFFEEVKNASHHGNTVHGWYAKGNASEKIKAILWIIGFPIGTNGIAFYLISKFKSNKE